MKFEEISRAFKELGHPIRLSIVKRLIRAGFQGIPVGTLQEELNIPNSTLSHHISSLVHAGLMMQRKEGRTLFCVLKYENVKLLQLFLEKDCCVDEYLEVKENLLE
ncbi:MAG: transcriptional regulator [Chloroflexi bacterium]|nr:transcriptional regulator [Chloroflexota bacterium]|tara:strand:- start:23195 stop:23512 length:318 start_codon:yes stop_codon:yes gene_type:complete